MDHLQEIDVERIMAQVRETIQKRQTEVPAIESSRPSAYGQLAADLASLHNGYDIYHVHFTSHRKIFGWPIVLAKKVLRALLTPILERQLAYNAANTRVASALCERNEAIGQQQERGLQTLRVEVGEQQAAALQALGVEVGEQQASALQALRTDVARQIEQVGQQRASTFQAFREAVVGQVERLGQQQAATMAALQEMVAGEVAQLRQQQATTTAALQKMVAGEVARLGQEQATTTAALQKMVAGEVAQLGQQQATTTAALQKMVAGEVPRLGQQLQGGLAELDARLVQLKTQLILQERRITLLLEEARKRLPEPLDEKQLRTMVDTQQRVLDALYVSFEDQFRGTREDIKGRFRYYLPIIREAKLGTEQVPILDLGCGRGEWLELLREVGLQARGIDINPVLVAQCLERKLEVMEGDLITYLRTLPDACMGVITGFHIIEHLPFEVLISLLDETVRVLNPGGMAIFETPNPENVMVGSCRFYMDPTHRNPLPKQLMQFLAEARGLCHVEILPLHPPLELPVQEATEVAKRFNEYFYAPMDYALVGRRV